MEKIRVDASKSYDVLIGRDLLKDAGKYIAPFASGKCLIVSDDNVFPLYGKALSESLESAGIVSETFVFPHGEEHKNMETYESLLEYMASVHMTRQDTVIALGGGVTGDLAGFAAATYQRGIGLIQMPTTLLAAVDSSVGGKTAIDLKAGKNQVGCFYQPDLVLCDIDTLQTLPEEEYRCGCAEIIKYAVIKSPALFEDIDNSGIDAQYERVIRECVSIKRDYVASDEFDTGERMFLNFGHTFGHAIEALSGYTVPHGMAVAAGMAIMARSACKRGICEDKTVSDIEGILEKYGLPADTEFSAHDMAEVIRADKKAKGDTITIVVPEAIGKCSLQKVALSGIEDWLKDGGVR